MSKPKVKDVLATVLAQFGFNATEANTILEATAADADIDDAVSTKLGAKLLTVDAAKADSIVRTAIITDALDGFDKLANRVLKDLKLPDDKAAPILSAKNTHAKIEALIKAATDAKAEEVGKLSTDKGAAEKAIRELNEQIVTLRGEHETALKNKDASFDTERVDMRINDILAQLEYTMDGVPKEMAIAAAKGVLGQVVGQKGVKYKLTPDKGLVLQKSDDQPYFENNQEITPGDFIKRELTAAKLLKVSPGSQAPGKPAQPAQRSTTNGEDKTIHVSNRDLLDEAIQNSQGGGDL